MTFEYFERRLTSEQVTVIPEMLNERVCNMMPGDRKVVSNDAIWADDSGLLWVDFTYDAHNLTKYEEIAEYDQYALLVRTRQGMVVILTHQEDNFDCGVPTFNVPPDSVIQQDIAESEPVVGLIYDKETLNIFNELFEAEFGRKVVLPTAP